jgi:hypothetical protein
VPRPLRVSIPRLIGLNNRRQGKPTRSLSYTPGGGVGPSLRHERVTGSDNSGQTGVGEEAVANYGHATRRASPPAD